MKKSIALLVTLSAVLDYDGTVYLMFRAAALHHQKGVIARCRECEMHEDGRSEYLPGY